MSIAMVLDFLGAFFAGLLAGMEIAIHYGVRAPSEVLDDKAQLQLRQALVTRLRVMVPAFFVPTAVFAIAGTVLDSSPPGEWFRIAGVLALVVWIVIRVIGTVPINSATLTWQLSAPPKDWKEQVNHAERFHDVGIGAAVLAFSCFLLAVGLGAVIP
jgi:protein-S-isoprenylcysteine O-methyltransferase Ste14